MSGPADVVKFDDICSFTPRQRIARHAIRRGYQYILYGGALGGGKSFFLRWILLWYLMTAYAKYGLKSVEVMLACETIPTLKDRQISKIVKEFPPYLGEYKDDDKAHGRCYVLNPEYGGGILKLRNLDDPSKYQSAEFAAIGVDELTKNKLPVFTDLRMRLRWDGIPTSRTLFLGATNPGGVGHGFCKQLWIDKEYGPEWCAPIDYRPWFAFIPSKADDNPHLDSAYWGMLQTLPTHLRSAFRDGCWDLYIGQAFPEFGPRHIIAPFEIPDHWPRYMTFDWGFGKPFSVGWWRVDNDGRLYRVNEWYGWNGMADQGLRMADTQVALGIRQREKEMGWEGKDIIRLCDPTCMNKKPDTRGGGQAPSTADEFAEHSVFLSPGDPARKEKLNNFRIRLQVPEDRDERPMLVVFDTCKQFRRTIPNIIMDSANIEDIDTTTEDHGYDDAGLICNQRPIKPKVKKPPVPDHIKDIIEAEIPDSNREQTYTDVLS